MDLSNPGSTEIMVALSGPLVIAAYVGLIVIPAWTSYGRWWERFAATFLTLYILVAMVGIGAGIGLGIIWTYDQWAA
jgi:hypothetical protein